MALVASSREEHLHACREQVRQILQNVQTMGLRYSKPVEPPRVTHIDILMREVQDLNHALGNVQPIINKLAMTLCASTIVGTSALGAYFEFPLMSVAVATALTVLGTGTLWACITLQLRDL